MQTSQAKNIKNASTIKSNTEYIFSPLSQVKKQNYFIAKFTVKNRGISVECPHP